MTVEEYVRRNLEAAPPLSPAIRDRLACLLAPHRITKRDLAARDSKRRAA